MHSATFPGIEKRKTNTNIVDICSKYSVNYYPTGPRCALTQSTTQLRGSLKPNSKKSCSSSACVWAVPFCAAVSSWVYKKGKQATGWGGSSSVSSGNLMNAPRVPHVLLIRCITTRARFESASKSWRRARRSDARLRCRRRRREKNK